MAALSAAFWEWDDGIGLTTMAQRLRFFAPDNIAAELDAAEVPGPIAAAAAGWRAPCPSGRRCWRTWHG